MQLSTTTENAPSVNEALIHTHSIRGLMIS